MKEILIKLNKVLESRVRLGIMSALMVNDNLDYNRLKELLDVSDGNLASHIKALEKQEMISVHKQFLGRKPNTTYSVTEKGKQLFKQHLKALELIINKI